MKIPIRGNPRHRIEADIKFIENEIGATELVSDGMDISDVSLELIAIDYLRSKTQNKEKRFSHKGLERLKDDDQYNKKEWIYFDKDSNEYKTISVQDLFS